MTTACASLKLTDELLEASKLRADSMGFQSWSAYMVALMREDLIRRQDLPTARKIALLKPDHRDAIDREILDLCKSSLPTPPSPPAEKKVSLVDVMAN